MSNNATSVAKTIATKKATAAAASNPLAVAVGLGILALIVSLVVVASAATSNAAQSPTNISPGGGQPSAYARQIIPPDMLALYLSSRVQQECPGMSWTVTAAITHLESDDNRNPGVSSAGAVGANQFLLTTWDAGGQPVVKVTPNGNVPNGFGVDGDGDGLADIKNPKDSVPAAARYLCASGGGNPKTLAKAIFTYNQYAYNRKDQGVDDSITHAIGTRLRPNLMTALGAIAALSPIALGIGAGAQLHQPLAIAVIGGFILALPLLLIVLPSMLRLVHRGAERKGSSVANSPT